MLIGFESEAKTLGDAFGPTEKDGFGRHAIEAVIDFDGGELFAVKREHFFVGKSFRIEGALPLLVRVTGSADAECSGAGNGDLQEAMAMIARNV